MSVQAFLDVGEISPLEITLSDEAWMGPSVATAPQAVPADTDIDVAKAAAAALKSPLGFPPISQALVPGDRVGIALGEGVREVADVVRGVVAALEWAGASRESIVVVTGSVAEADELRPQLDDLTSTGCLVVGHVATDDEVLCYLAAVDDEPLLISRQLFEADLVIPVGCARSPLVRDARGPYESVFPRFSDTLTQKCFAQADALDSPTASGIRRKKTDQAGWLLGAPLVMLVVPRRGGGVARVLAGAPSDVERAVQDICCEQWNYEVEQPASLVVATLGGAADEQTWDNVARALFAAGKVADMDQSAVALCTALNSPPGETLRKLIATGGDLEHAALLRNSQSEDAGAAWEIYKALCRGPVYFMSRLDDEVVEDIGMTPIAELAELARLAQRSSSCVVLNEVQHAATTLVD